MMDEQQEWREDDVVVAPERPDLQFVLWQKHTSDESWQVFQVYDSFGTFKTVNFAGFWSAAEVEKATKVGTWNDKERRVVLLSEETTSE